MRLPLLAAAGATVLAALALAGGAGGFASVTYPDRTGDVTGGAGPDLAAVTLSSTASRVTFRIRFTKAPPLRAGARQGWVDMLLIGIDVPPLGPKPLPNGGWRGMDFALGTHGPSKTGLLVRLGGAGTRRLARFPIVTAGSTMSFSIARRALGDPAWFRFQVAAARETEAETGGGVDFAPAARTTFRYALGR
jgi:hypothetical protein